MSSHRARYLLDEDQVPTHWYNVLPDLTIGPPPARRPGQQAADTDGKRSMLPQLPLSMYRQSVSQERFIRIPDEVRREYQRWRPTPLIRAHALERELDTPAHLSYKYEGANPAGSHKLNSALAQAYYYRAAGVTELVTGTGAGQWGTALAVACRTFGLNCTVFMVRCSYHQKPGRGVLMRLHGATTIPSPSTRTESGRRALAGEPDTDGSLSIANAEALEYAHATDGSRFSIGSGENHVLLQQTVIGEEALRQFAMAGEFPDVVIGSMGAGSNFAGLAFPFYREKVRTGADTRLVAVEPTACPKMTRGVYAWDYNDISGITPMTKMYTLGASFTAPSIHSGGLRYHGAAPLVSAMYHHGLLEAVAYPQRAVFDAAATFARTEWLAVAPESAHAVRCAIDEALRARAERRPTVILFNVSGHGLLDLGAYEQYLLGDLLDHTVPDELIAASLARLP